jgi:hypothetical protein
MHPRGPVFFFFFWEGWGKEVLKFLGFLLFLMCSYQVLTELPTSIPTFPNSTSLYPISFDLSFTLVKVSFHVAHPCTTCYFERVASDGPFLGCRVFRITRSQKVSFSLLRCDEKKRFDM